MREIGLIEDSADLDDDDAFYEFQLAMAEANDLASEKSAS
jgi:hypothetical protein